MATTDDLQLPIKRKSVSGAAVEYLDSRKEDNDGPRMTEEKLEGNRANVRDGTAAALKTISGLPKR